MRNRKFQPAFDALQSRIAPGQVFGVSPPSEYIPPSDVPPSTLVPPDQIMISPMDPASGLDYDKALVSPMDPAASPPSNQIVNPVYGPGDFQTTAPANNIA